MAKTKLIIVCDEKTEQYMCDNCRRERAGKIRKGALAVVTTVGSVAMFVITKGKHGGNKA